MSKIKKEKKYVVGTKSKTGPGKSSRSIKFVDSRMKKDKRKNKKREKNKDSFKTKRSGSKRR